MDAFLKKINISDDVWLDGQQVFLKSTLVGQITDLSIRWRESGIVGTVAVNPTGQISFSAFASVLAKADVSAEYHVPGEFWPSSYKKDGEWYVEYFDGNHLKIEKLQG
jgi:hypothetical protein